MISLFAILAGSTQALHAANETRILIMGDSWGTISPATDEFKRELNEHKCPLQGFTNIAIGGTTAQQWAEPKKMLEVKKQAKDHDLVWVTLMGNDALAVCPDCAKAGKTAEECGDELTVKATGWMTTIIDGIHEANPNAKIVGFGYDIMFGGFGCESITKTVFPQCWSNKSVANPIRCFNTEFIRLQALWDTLASTRPYLSAINILGTTQMGAGDPGVTIGNPNLDKFGPAKDWPLTLECIHPSKAGGDKSGAMLIMAQFYEQYWGKELGC
jgi:hypothetical protein